MMPPWPDARAKEAFVLRAVLFDLDGTLLDLDLRAFLARYFAALEVASAPIVPPKLVRGFMDGMNAAVGAMTLPHSGRTNQDVFYAELMEHTGVDLHEHWHVFETFYAQVFPTLRDTARPAPGGREAVETALALDLGVAVATNPIFPRAAIAERLAWAGLDDLDLPVVTTYESMHACKPHPEYFRQTASLLGAAPTECLMVGDDRALDMPAADVGMQTFYVGSDPDAPADMRGDLVDLARLLPRLV